MATNLRKRNGNAPKRSSVDQALALFPGQGGAIRNSGDTTRIGVSVTPKGCFGVTHQRKIAQGYRLENQVIFFRVVSFCTL